MVDSGSLLRLYEKRHARYELEHLRRSPMDNIVVLDARKGHIINFDPSIGREIASTNKDRLYHSLHSRFQEIVLSLFGEII